MHYKTIILELLQANPDLHDQVRQARMLLPVMECCATALR